MSMRLHSSNVILPLALPLGLALALSLALALAIASQALAQTMEFVYPAPFQKLRAAVDRSHYSLKAPNNLLTSAYKGNIKVVAEGQVESGASLNPQIDNAYNQLVEPRAWVENSYLPSGKWIFMPGAGLRGKNTVGINHGDDILCSCNSPEHSARMILPHGAIAQGEIIVNYAEQYIFGDYHANTRLNNGAFQIIFPQAQVFGNTKINDNGETHLLGKIMPGAAINVLPGGVLRVQEQGKIDGTLNVQGGLAFAYKNVKIGPVVISKGGSFLSINQWSYNNVSTGEITIEDGSLDASGGKFKSIIAQKGEVIFHEPGVLDKSPGPSVTGLLQIGPEVKLTLEGDTTPLALDSPTSRLELKNGVIALQAAWWQTTSTIKAISGKGKIVFEYDLNQSGLMAYNPTTALNISQLIVLSGNGDFELEIRGDERKKNDQGEFLNPLRPVPDEFVLIVDHSNALSISMPKAVTIANRKYTLEMRGESPRQWVLKTAPPLPQPVSPNQDIDTAAQ